MSVPSFIATRDGVRIAYATCGAGPPLVFVRGWVSDLDVFWQEPRFRSYIEAFARHFSVVRYDCRGNGLSERLVRHISLDALVLDLEGVIDGLGLQQMVLYGSSFGGPVAMLYAARHPERVHRLVLDGTYARGREITTRLRQLFIRTSLRYFPEMAWVFLSYATQPEGQQEVYRRPERLQQAIAPVTAAQLYKVGFHTDVSGILPGIKTPTLVLHRVDSHSIPVRLGREVAALIPGARFVALPGAAHNPWEGDPRPALEAVGAFLGVDLALAAPADSAERLVAVPAGASGERDLVGSHYRLDDLVSEGHMGVVYKGYDTRIDRPVVLKFLPPELAHRPDGLERFHREARATSRLSHPNICTVYDVGEDARGPFIVLEWLEGQTLKRVIGGRPVPAPRLIEWGIQAADALATAHGAGIIHRDVKSANLFVTQRNEIKVLDFGLAKLLEPVRPTDTTREELTQPGAPVGTAAYMSPEQVRGERLDARTDVFSLGVVLFEMATGRLPFEGDTVLAVLDQIVNRAPRRVRELNPELPPDLDRIIGKALAKNRDLRYQSAADLRADLLALRDEQWRAATPTPPTQ